MTASATEPRTIGSTNGAHNVIIVGAGLAGLVCANVLLAAGRAPLVIDAQPHVGGRVQTDVTTDGFRLDRGFQVLFSAYPALRRHVAIRALQPRYFDAGFDVIAGGDTHTLVHPLHHPLLARHTFRSGLIGPRDMVALLRVLTAALRSPDASLSATGVSALAEAYRFGASTRFIDGILRPLFGGISLDRSGSSDSAFWHFVLHSLVFGRVFLPAYGIGQLPASLASRLPTSSIRTATSVTGLLVEHGAVAGVHTATGTIAAQRVVVATDATSAGRLTGLVTPEGHRSCTTAYFWSTKQVSHSKRLILNAGASLVNHVVQLTAISPHYAPYGRHLLSATALDDITGLDDEVSSAMIRDMRTWLPRADESDLQPISVVRVPYAQFAQPPGIYARLPGVATDETGLYLSGEYLHSSSVQGAMLAGEMAARAVLSGGVA